MSVATLLSELQWLGVVLSAEGDRLCYEAPKGVMTPERKQRLAQHKAGILELLAGPRKAAPISRWAETSQFQNHLPGAQNTHNTQNPAAAPPAAGPKPDHRLPCCCPTAICWRCCDRPCVDCGRPTGTPFIGVCIPCEVLRDKDAQARQGDLPAADEQLGAPD